MQELADEAIEKAQPEITDFGLGDASDLEAQIRPSQRASQEAAEATNESWKRWSRMLTKTLREAKRNPKDPLNLRRRKLTARDIAPTFQPDPEWLQFSEEELDDNSDGKVSRKEYASNIRKPTEEMQGQEVDGEYFPTTDEMELMADELGMEIDELPGYDPRVHKRLTPEERQAELMSGSFDGEAKLRELVAMNIYPSIRTPVSYTHLRAHET